MENKEDKIYNFVVKWGQEGMYDDIFDKELRELITNDYKNCVSDNLYQDDSIRGANGLIFKMKQLFNEEKLTTWEYNEFIKMVLCFAKDNNLHFEKNEDMLYKKD